MVCISCILIPIAIFVWHKFLAPLFTHFFPNWSKSVEQKLEGGTPEGAKQCPFKPEQSNGSAATTANTDNDKKDQ